MGKNANKNHSDGMNDFNERRIIEAFESGDGYALDTVVHSVTGTRRAIRRSAEAAFIKFIKKNGEIPTPTLEQLPQQAHAHVNVCINNVQVVPVD